MYDMYNSEQQILKCSNVHIKPDQQGISIQSNKKDSKWVYNEHYIQ